MTDLSRIVDFSGSTIICNDVQAGTGTIGGLEAVSANLPSLVTLTTTQNQGGKFTLANVNCNTASHDNTIPITLPTGVTNFKVRAAYVTCVTGNLAANAATAGLFSATGAGGTAIVADGVLTPTTNAADTAANMQVLTLASAANTTSFSTATTNLYFRTGTKTNAAATCNVTVDVDYIV